MTSILIELKPWESVFEFMDYARMIVIFIRKKTIVCDEELFRNNKIPDASSKKILQWILSLFNWNLEALLVKYLL